MNVTLVKQMFPHLTLSIPPIRLRLGVTVSVFLRQHGLDTQHTTHVQFCLALYAGEGGA